jgi:DNA invertase Pin-like site-specific DNA recombinase
MTVRIYLRASTKDQDANRAEQLLLSLAGDATVVVYKENVSGTKLERPELNRLLDESSPNDILLVESVDRLSRLNADDFDSLKLKIKAKQLHLVVADLPTTHQALTRASENDTMQQQLMLCVSNMLIDLLATMARIDNDKRIERIKQGLANKTSTGWKPQGKQVNKELHEKIRKYLIEGRLTKQEIAATVDCGIATVYRVKV